MEEDGIGGAVDKKTAGGEGVGPGGWRRRWRCGRREETADGRGASPRRGSRRRRRKRRGGERLQVGNELEESGPNCKEMAAIGAAGDEVSGEAADAHSTFVACTTLRDEHVPAIAGCEPGHVEVEESVRGKVGTFKAAPRQGDGRRQRGKGWSRRGGGGVVDGVVGARQAERGVVRPEKLDGAEPSLTAIAYVQAGEMSDSGLMMSGAVAEQEGRVAGLEDVEGVGGLDPRTARVPVRRTGVMGRAATELASTEGADEDELATDATLHHRRPTAEWTGIVKEGDGSVESPEGEAWRKQVGDRADDTREQRNCNRIGRGEVEAADLLGDDGVDEVLEEADGKAAIPSLNKGGSTVTGGQKKVRGQPGRRGGGKP